MKLSINDLKSIAPQYAAHATGYNPVLNKSEGILKVLREHLNQKLWEDMSENDRLQELCLYIETDSIVALNEIKSLNPIKYFEQRAHDPLDPLKNLYQLILNGGSNTL